MHRNYLRRTTDPGIGKKSLENGVKNVFSEASKQQKRFLDLVR